MDEAQRYAPPAAVVADVPFAGEVQPVRLWPPRGRMGRLRFFAYGVGLYVVFLVLSLLVGAVAGALRSGTLTTVGTVVLVLLYLAGEVVLLIQRSHDMDLSGWWSIAAFIPLVGLYWLFKAGTPGGNRWGAPPPPNSPALRTTSIVLAVLLAIGIVAAIALPAMVGSRTGTTATTR